ncbi:MAG: hypothetical protein AAGF98_05560 [Cyanobacteria bacterium P01_H01_bin.153]
MKTNYYQSQVVENLLMRMDPAVAATFSTYQRQALQIALMQRRHRVNIRLSIPCFWKRFYLVILAGSETRSPARLKIEAARNPLWTPLNMLVIFGSMFAGLLALLGILQISSMDFSRISNPTIAPAEIPFKDNRASCEASGRVWKEDACFDYEHDPIF